MEKHHDDPMVDLISNSKLIDLVSTLIAKLERVSYDETRSSVFKTKWALSLFDECIKRIKYFRKENDLYTR